MHHRTMPARLALVAVTAFVTAGAATAAVAVRWGFHGHEMAGRAAATALPAEMPAFFRTATEQLSYLNYEPDRWRGDGFRELNEAMRYDHYIDMEVIPANVLGAADRFEYLFALKDSGLVNPPRDAGLVHFRIVELYQSLVIEWRLWRQAANDPERRRMIEERIINDAGILGHYVTDGANPHHTSVHHNRWAEGYPNPRGFTTEDGFHARFESIYVENNIEQSEIMPYVNERPRTLTAPRTEVMAFLQRSHSRLERLYELDLEESWGAATTGAAHRAFAVERLAAGANMLRDLWWSAYVESAASAPAGR